MADFKKGGSIDRPFILSGRSLAPMPVTIIAEEGA
jgi:hypothetical protein